MNIGICGGTFDPIHLGHLLIGEQVGTVLNLQKVIYIPAKMPPHKLDNRITPCKHRLAMLRIATDGNEKFDVSDLELLRSGPSYTVTTLEYFKERWPDSSLFFLMGQDTFNEIETWHRFEDIFRLSRIVVVNRPGSIALQKDQFSHVVQDYIRNGMIEFNAVESDQALLDRDWRICGFAISALDISASEIRKRVEKGRSIRYLVPEPVRGYIEDNRLYRGIERVV